MVYHDGLSPFHNVYRFLTYDFETWVNCSNQWLEQSYQMNKLQTQIWLLCRKNMTLNLAQNGAPRWNINVSQFLSFLKLRPIPFVGLF